MLILHFVFMPEQTTEQEKNPPDLLRRVYDIQFSPHTIFISPESKYDDDGDDVSCLFSLSVTGCKYNYLLKCHSKF
jgi:hypothetical protein